MCTSASKKERKPEMRMCARSFARLRENLSFLGKQNAFRLCFLFSSFAAAATARLPSFARFCLFDFDYLFVQWAEAYAIDVFVHVHWALFGIDCRLLLHSCRGMSNISMAHFFDMANEQHDQTNCLLFPPIPALRYYFPSLFFPLQMEKSVSCVLIMK